MKLIARLSFINLCLGLLIIFSGCSKKKQASEVQDINAVRAELKEQVSKGKLSQAEAIVQLAEATKAAKFGTKKKGQYKKQELSPELQAFGKDLKERMKKGELTDEEAKAAWLNVTGKTKAKSKSQKTQDTKKDQKGEASK